MAIEKAYGPLDAPPMPEEPEMAMGAASPDEGETLSMSLLGGNEVKPGDVVRIRVQSVDEQNGTWQGAYAEAAAPQSSRLGEMMMKEKMEGAMS